LTAFLASTSPQSAVTAHLAAGSAAQPHVEATNPEALAAAAEQGNAEQIAGEEAPAAATAAVEAVAPVVGMNAPPTAFQTTLLPTAELPTVPNQAAADQATLNNQPLPAAQEPLECGQSESMSSTNTATESSPSLWTAVATHDPGALLAQACDSLVENLPIDLTAVDEALSELLNELEELGQDLATSLAQVGVSPWIAVAAMGAAAGELHRRRRSQSRVDPPGSERDAVIKLFPELLGLVPRGDA
jgi:hypothetical protein